MEDCASEGDIAPPDASAGESSKRVPADAYQGDTYETEAVGSVRRTVSACSKFRPQCVSCLSRKSSKLVVLRHSCHEDSYLTDFAFFDNLGPTLST
eukprot:6193970-Pleurochrysis_carterae.AAC.1